MIPAPSEKSHFQNVQLFILQVYFDFIKPKKDSVVLCKNVRHLRSFPSVLGLH